MSTSNEFESRRHERRRRERLRKKRIRAAVILIALIAVIVLLCAALSTCSKKNTENGPDSSDDIVSSFNPSDAVVPTISPAQTLIAGIPPASQENDLLTILKNSGQVKHCYLTFDDGPTENITPQILDVLRRYNVKATFFEVGSLIEANPDMARRVYEEGHLIANHSDGHNYEKLYASTDAFINEINKCYETIKTVTDEDEPFKLVRFPGGSYQSSSDSYSPIKQECKTILKEQGFYFCDWNAVNGDAEGKKKNAQELLDYMKQYLTGEDNVVVLMHDAATKQTTADALPSIIEYFASEGYTFHRLDDINYQGTLQSTSDDTASSQPSTDDGDYSSSSATGSTPASTDITVTRPTSAPSGVSSGAIVIQ